VARKLKIWAGLGLALAVMPVETWAAGPVMAASVAGEAGETATVGKADNSQGEYIAALGLVDAYVHLAGKLPKVGALARAQKLAVELGPTLEKHKTTLVVAGLKSAHAAIKLARGSGEDVSAHSMVVAVLSLVQNAHTEFTGGGIHGKLNVLSSTQKAWGMVQAAKSIMADITPQEREEHKGPLAEIDAALASVDRVWPDLKHDHSPQASPALLAAAAAKIEFALSAIQ